MIGRWLGGDKGAEVAGKVLDAAQVVTGARSVDDMIKAAEQDSVVAGQLRLRLMDIAKEAEERDAKDRADARAMQIAALQQTDEQAKRFVYNFAWFWSAFATLYILMVTFVPMPAGNARYADMVLGFLLGTVVATILTFFYGSSRGSQAQSATMQELVKGLTKH
jgi:lipopolysaccharide export LptBFGC system permease protein LptF